LPYPIEPTYEAGMSRTGASTTFRIAAVEPSSDPDDGGLATGALVIYGAFGATVVGCRCWTDAEKQALHEVLDSVRAGMSGALVLRGEPGVGKSASLDYAIERAADLQIVRTVAVESEMALGFAAVHQLLVPFLHGVDRLPGHSGGPWAWPSGWRAGRRPICSWSAWPW
jgi:hypothetical protein